MPNVRVSVRYKSFGDDDQAYFASCKNKQRVQILKDYPDATNLKQSIATDGIPDATNLGGLRENGEIAVITTFDVSEETAVELKKRMR